MLTDDAASEIRDSNLLPMLYKILPIEYSEKLQDDPTVRTVDDVVARVTRKCRRHNQLRLADIQQQKREAAVKAGSTSSFVHAAVPSQGNGDNMADFMKTLTSNIVAALGRDQRRDDARQRGRKDQRSSSPRARSDSPKLWRNGACLECGSDKHTEKRPHNTPRCMQVTKKQVALTNQ